MGITPAVNLLLRVLICVLIYGSVLVLPYEDPDCKVRSSIQTSIVTRDGADVNRALCEYDGKNKMHTKIMKPIMTFATDKAVLASRAIQKTVISFFRTMSRWCVGLRLSQTMY